MCPDTTLEDERKARRKAARVKRVREDLQHFDELPDSAHVRLPIVTKVCGCGAATVWRHVREKRLPSPVRLGPKISAWNVGALRAHLAARAAGVVES